MARRPAHRKELIVTHPTRALRRAPDLQQLRRQAKELHRAFLAGDPAAHAEVRLHLRDADPAAFALHDAQLVLARSYGFDSWPKLKAHVDRQTVAVLIDAIRSKDVARVRAMIEQRPELVHLDTSAHDERRALHHAVLERAPEIVRIVMLAGADARRGVYPHRDATGALTLAAERGDDEIAGIILEEEQRRHDDAASAPDSASDSASAGRLTEAVRSDDVSAVMQLVKDGLDPDERVRVPGVDEVMFSWGLPLWTAAGNGQYAVAEVLLRGGADPNARVYASGTPLFAAYAQHDEGMIDLLMHNGGIVDATAAGLFGDAELARRMLSGEAPAGLGDTFGGESVAEGLLWGAACGGSPEIVKLALAQIDWRRDDARWFRVLEQPLRMWTFGRHHPPRSAYLACFAALPARADPNLRGRFGTTILHEIAGARPHVTDADRVAFARIALDAGARTDVRDELLRSTPLGWAARWGAIELVRSLLARGADPIEPDAEPWATPSAWARKMAHDEILTLLSDRS